MKLIITCGFLGSGKTTAIANACIQLPKENTSFAVVTNDQGEQQVDGAHIGYLGIPYREVSNGCFCCNYDQLYGHIQSLLDTNQPEIVFAESVGSCTDLVATIAKPFKKFRPLIETVICTFTDAFLLLEISEGRASFISENIRYIYKKQLQEADIIILNKTDLVSSEQLIHIHEIIKTEYPDKEILHQNSHSQNDISKWLQLINTYKAKQNRSSLEIDYTVYGKGEAELAWLDQKISIRSASGRAFFVANHFVNAVRNILQQNHLLIGHLKFFVEAEGFCEKISFTMNRGDRDLLPVEQLAEECSILINARLQTEPEILKMMVDKVISETADKFDCNIFAEKAASFKPGFPTPTHRFV